MTNGISKMMNGKSGVSSTIILSVMCWTSLLAVVTHPSSVLGISCYTCNSRNFTSKACHDPFHPAHVSYTEHCKTPKVAHIGVFPASFCVKVKGLNEMTNEELVIRTCTTENMNNQCGIFKFEKETLTGCIVTCDSDGCNNAVTVTVNVFSLGMMYLLLQRFFQCYR